MTITKESPRLRQSLCIVPLMASVACGSVAGTDHKGNSLLQITGSVRMDNEDAPADLVPALAFASENDFLVQDVDVSGEFPARFTLNVYEPPPPETFHADSRRPEIAYAYLTAVPPRHESKILIPRQTDTLGDVPCDGLPAEASTKWCTSERECYEERMSCTCPVPADELDPGELPTCGEAFETSGDPVIKDPWSKFGGVSQNYVVIYVPEASLATLNEEPFFSQDYTGGKGFKLGYNLIHVRSTTPEEQKAAAECEPAIRAQAWDEYNAEHGTDYSDATDESWDGPYGEASDWVNSRFTELQLIIYCPDNAWVMTAVDPDSTSIEVHLGKSLEPVTSKK
jgi:hypothetical protein